MHEILRDVTISNGLAWTPDGATMYYIDTPTQRVDVFEIDPVDGNMAGRRDPLDVPAVHGMPDGMTIDDEGCL